LGFAALFVFVGAGIAYVVAIIIPSPDTAILAISLGALGLVGAIIWVMATVLASLMKIVMTDVREEFRGEWLRASSIGPWSIWQADLAASRSADPQGLACRSRLSVPFYRGRCH
jgi:hypothetical protein